MRIVYIPLVVVLFILVTHNVSAQSSPTDNAAKSDKEASFKVSVNYLNNNVFMGRADTISTPVILPEIKYSFKNGIFLSGSIDVIPNRVKNKLDAGSLSAGYNYDITDNLGGAVSYTKLFYNANSTQIGSSISSTFSADLDYNIADIITPSLSVDYNIIKQGFGNDVFINGGIAHDFAKEGIFTDNDLFIISPTAAVNTGTQNFYDAYFVLKKYKGVAKNAVEKKLFATQKQKLSKYTLLDYEFSAPVEYKTGIFILSFVPTYAVAENKLPPRVTAGMVNQSGIFFFEAGAALKF